MEKPISVPLTGLFCTLFGLFSSFPLLVLSSIGVAYFALKPNQLSPFWAQTGSYASYWFLFWACMPIVAVLTQKRDSEKTIGTLTKDPTLGSEDQEKADAINGAIDYAIRRSSFRGIFRIYATPDERGFGLYEPTVKTIYEALCKISEPFAYYITQYYWIGFRNFAHGLCAEFGKPAIGFIRGESNDFWDEQHLNYERPEDGVWKCVRYPFGGDPTKGGFHFQYGWQVYTTIDGSFQARPLFTARAK